MVQFKNINQISNKYDAGGRKLSTEYLTLLYTITTPIAEGVIMQWSYNPMIMDKAITTYIDNKEYDSKNYLGGIPNRIYNPEGYADALTSAGGPQYKYYRRDHLGNVCEVWRAAYSVYIPSRNITLNYTATTLQRTQYYPSGLPWAANTGDNPGLQNKKYNAKEFIEMHGYDISDYGWRGLENATMRFNTIDPLTEKYYSWSPYNYCMGNPIRFIDPDGTWVDDYYFGFTGKLDYVVKTDDPDRFYKADKNRDNKEISIVQLSKDMLGSYTDVKTSLANGDYTFDRGVFDADNTKGLGGDNSWAKNTQTGLDAFGVVNTLKTGLIDYSVRTNYKSSRSVREFNKLRSTQKNWRTINTLGKGGAGYLKAFKILGKATGIASSGIAISEAFQNPTAGNIIQAVSSSGLAVIRINPIVGIGLGIMDVTGASDYIYDLVGSAIEEN